MSADTMPISPGRFAAALKGLSPSMLHLKVLEIRNSVAHLQWSNDQLQPYADGSATAADGDDNGSPDQDCVDAIRENEGVIDRMAERIALIRAEVEERGMAWAEFDRDRGDETAAAAAAAAADDPGTNGLAGAASSSESAGRHPAWADGTFQTGSIRGGQVRFDSAPGQAGARNGHAGAETQMLQGQLGNVANPGHLAGRDTSQTPREQQVQGASRHHLESQESNNDDADGGMHL
ncbi:hypothetical protein HIM_04014 [Hirsutella minnesotensis 3608]|uniref:Uncharacterized protein n=1 Tax=Hirsutella minnesotensis 3608 TaxID=1043627 RepID=A0A0F7ZVI6_9HYPO|nr:hypothetical protein HIM_04014 [Hirsutella minnesotensis 3608]